MTDATLIDPQFEQLLGDYELAPISGSDETIYGVWPDLTLGYVNQGWTRFADRNHGEPEITENWSLGLK